MSSIWIKNPLAIYTPNGVDAQGGIVVEQQQIVEYLDEQSFELYEKPKTKRISGILIKY